MYKILKSSALCLLLLSEYSVASPKAKFVAAGSTSCVEQSKHLVQEQFIESGNAILQVKIVGKGQAVLLVPGFARGAADYKEVSLLLADRGYQTITVNPRGVELSSGPWAKTTIDEIADDLHNVIKSLGVGPLVGVGHAAGGRFVRMLATKHPEDISSLVLLSSGGKFQNKEKFNRFMDAVLRNVRGEITPAEMRQVMRTTGSFAKKSDVTPWITGWWAVAPAQAVSSQNVKPEDYLAGGGRQILALYGEEDQIAPNKNSLLLKKTLGDQVQLQAVKNAGHNMLQEQPEIIADAIDRWAQKH